MIRYIYRFLSCLKQTAVTLGICENNFKIVEIVTDTAEASEHGVR